MKSKQKSKKAKIPSTFSNEWEHRGKLYIYNGGILVMLDLI